MKGGFDLSNFKKVKESATHAVLEHPDGHQIHIAKNALKPKTLAQLAKLKLPAKMAEGGQVANQKEKYQTESQRAHVQPWDIHPYAAAQAAAIDPPMRLEEPEKHMARMASESFQEVSKHLSKKKLPHEPQKMAEGGIAMESPNPPGNIYPSSYEQQMDVSGMGSAAGGLPTPAQMAQPNVFQPVGQMGQPKMQGAPTPQPGAYTTNPAGPTNPIIGDIAKLSGAAKGQGPGVNLGGVADAMGQYMGSIERAYGQQEAGLKAQAAAEARLGQREADAAAADQSLKLMIKQNHEDEFNKLNGEISGAIKDIDQGHLDPKHYINSKSDFGKVSTAIGLILGGIGSGLTGQPNAALEFLNRQIDRDILAQRANLGKKQTVLEGYLRQVGNLNDATKMTWAFYNDLYTNELKKQAALVRDPIAKAEAQRLIGEREAQKAQVLAPLAFQRALMNSMQGGKADPAAAIRLYGQMGILQPAQVNEAFKELQMIENHEKQSRMIMDAFDKAVGENTVGNRAAHLGAEPAAVDQLMTLVIPYLKDAAGRVSDTELEIVKGLVPRPGDMSYKAQEKRAGFIDFLRTKLATPTLNSVGIYPNSSGALMSRPNQSVIPGYGGQ